MLRPPSLSSSRYTRAQAYLVGHCASLADAARAGELEELLSRARAEAADAVREAELAPARAKVKRLEREVSRLRLAHKDAVAAAAEAAAAARARLDYLEVRAAAPESAPRAPCSLPSLRLSSERAPPCFALRCGATGPRA